MGTAFGNFVSAHSFEDVVLTTPPSNFRVTGNSNSLITTYCGPTTGSFVLPIVYWVVMRNATDTLVTRAQLDTATAWLNRDFANNAGFAAPTGMSFAPAKRDPNGNATSGVKYVDGSILPAYSQYGVGVTTNSTGFAASEFANYFTWDHNRYINIYIVDSIYNGYGGITISSPLYFYEGIFIVASEIPRNMHSLAHEMGHYFDLRHTFEGSSGYNCPSNNNCATDGDRICDTPPHRSIDAFLTTPCYSGSDVLNSLQNFMSYGSTKNRFTAGQKDRMINDLLTYRSLTTSDALLSPTTALEIAVATIEHGDVFYACGKGDVQFTLSNEGLDSVSVCTTKVYVDDIVAKTVTMSINLGRGATGFYTVVGVPISFGSHTIKVEISNFDGKSDYSAVNNVMCKSVDVQRKMFYVGVQRSSYDLTVSGTDNYLCGVQANLAMDYDTSLFESPRWADEAGQVRSESRYWSFNVDSNAIFMASVQPKKVVTTTVINHGGQDNSVKIYPNPTTDQFTVELSSQSLSKSQIEIIDITGRIVIAQDFSTRSSNVDISQLSAGEYIVRITDDQGFLVTKILKN
jgi:hypothetical protein